MSATWVGEHDRQDPARQSGRSRYVKQGHFLPALIERLLGVDTTPAQIARTTGILAATYMLALFICAPLWGWLSDTWGRRRVLLIGLAGFSTTMIASVLFKTLASI